CIMTRRWRIAHPASTRPRPWCTRCARRPSLASQAATAQLSACTAEVDRLQSLVDAQIHRARTAMEVLTAQAQARVDQVEHGITDIASQVQALQTQSHTLHQSLGEEMQQMHSGLETLRHDTQALETALDADLDAICARLDGLQQLTQAAVARHGTDTAELGPRVGGGAGEVGPREKKAR